MVLLLMAIFLHASSDISLLLVLLEFLSLVVLSFSAGKCDFDLCESAIVEVYLQGHEGKAPLGEFAGDFSDLGFVEEELSIASGFVVVGTSLGVLGDRASYEPAFAVDYSGIGAFEVALAVTQRFDLCSEKDNPCLDLFDQLEVVIGLFVADLRAFGFILFFRFLCHCHLLPFTASSVKIFHRWIAKQAVYWYYS